MKSFAVWTILGLTVCSQLYCCIGIIVLRGAYNKLHCLSTASICGGVLLIAAVLLASGFSEAGIKTLLACVILVFTGPILVHVTARAARIRECGDLAMTDDGME